MYISRDKPYVSYAGAIPATGMRNMNFRPRGGWQ